MNEFFWTGGHFGWGFFACQIVTAIWWLLGDAAWRLKQVALKRLLFGIAAGWAWSIAACALVWFAISNE